MLNALSMTALMLISLHAGAICQNPLPAQEEGMISNSRLIENSGMDFSRHHSGVFWSLNDNNPDPRIFAIDLNGVTKAEYQISGAVNLDWEDISVASCIHQPSKDCIYIADIGDNKRERNEFTIYVVEEPTSLSPQSQALSVAKKISFSANKQNFEAFAVNDKTHDFYLISKRARKKDAVWEQMSEVQRNKSALYLLSKNAKALKEIGDLDFENFLFSLADEDKIVTSGDFDTASGTLLIGTLGRAFEIKLSQFSQFATLANLLEIPSQFQAESIAYFQSKGQTSIITSSEGLNRPIYSISCQ